jgi:hypothetical protein
MKPRGLRNNNPGNIRLTKDNWQGLRTEQTDPDFFQFETMAYGFRALFKLLKNYRKKYGCQTIAEIIERYAPRNENDTNSYILTVCRLMEVPSTFVPDVEDKETMFSLAASICFVENGEQAYINDLLQGWELLKR